MCAAPDLIESNDWLEYAAAFPIAFAQVREDALIDRGIAEQLPASAHGIMIASGGCTAALLAASSRFERLTLVDMNPAQLALNKLKIAWVSACDTSERLSLLGHSPLSADQRKSALLGALQRHQLPVDIFGSVEAVAAMGIDYVGRYELLFTRLQYAIASNAVTEKLLMLVDPKEQKAFLRDHPEYVESLERAFNEVMSLPNLVRLFGKEATQSAVMPFAAHFFARTIQAIETLPADTNPYLAQLLAGKFLPNATYPWLQLPKQSIDTAIVYKQSAMAGALVETSETFNFIHLSNIFDWLNKEQAASLLALAAAKLKEGGWLTIRQLNSNLPIPELSSSLQWQKDEAAKQYAKDRSFFYQKLHIARK